MHTRWKNLLELKRICAEKGLVVAQTNSRRHGFVTDFRVYAKEEDKGNPEKALFDFGSYINQADLESVRNL